VLLPQAFRVILPPLSSELTNCFKNASVASLVGVMELISQTKTIREYTQNSLEIYTYATIIYLVFNLSLIAIMGLIERKLRVPGLIAGSQK
jgi:glutamate/aspartate transport system permease protein